MPAATAALAGVKVIDLTRLLPGPYLTQLLADLGAEVIRVEAPGGNDLIRHLPPRIGDTSAAFAALNRGKRSVCLDLKDGEQAQALRALCRTADVLIEGFRPGVMERLGLGPEVLRVDHPRLIYCRISGYGQRGEAALRSGHDVNYAARAGLLGMGEAPALPVAQIADLIGGALLPGIQILAALRRRDLCGEGVTIDAAMIDGAWTTLLVPLARHLAGGPRFGGGRDLLHGGTPTYGIYATQDGAIALGVLEPEIWQRLCGALARPDLAAINPVACAEPERIRAELAAIFAGRSTAEWVEALRAADCCVDPVRAPETAHLVDPVLQRRGHLAQIDVAGQRLEVPLTPVVVGPDVRPRTAAPALGADTRAVLEEAGVPLPSRLAEGEGTDTAT